MTDFSTGPDIRRAVDRAAERLGERARAADIEREAEKILASEWRAMYGSSGTRTPCRITADLSVSACTSRLPATVRALLYDAVRSTGSSLSSSVASWSRRPAPTPRLHVRLPDSAVLHAGHDASLASMLIRTLDRAALDSGIDVIEGPVFPLAVDGDLTLLETLPELLRQTKSVRPRLEIDAGSVEFLSDALYAIVLALLAPARGPHPAEVAVTSSPERRVVSAPSSPTLTVTVTAGSGSDLTHAGRQAFQTGRSALDELTGISTAGAQVFRPGAVLVALSAEHAGAIARRISAGSVRGALLADVPRGAATDVVVDGYPLGLAPRNRLSLTPDADPRETAAEIGARLGTGTVHASRETSSPLLLLSTPAAAR